MSTTQERLAHLRQLYYSGASQVTIDGHTIQVSREDLARMIGELEQDDLTARVNNTARPDFFVHTYLPGWR